MRKNLIFAIFFVLLVNAVLGQKSSSLVTVYGSVKDSISGKPVEFASLLFLPIDKSVQSSGALANERGEIEIGNLLPGKYCYKVSFIGYKTFVSDTFLFDNLKASYNLGEIVISPFVQNLKDVVITGEKDQFEMQIEKKVFDVSKNTMATGGTATDALKQIPAVTVDMDGNLSMRGSGNITVWINGRPSGITGGSRQAILDQIPSSNIEKIELITNPSAKYDPDGMSGIINITLKKNTTFGANGNIAGGFGTRDKYNESVLKFNTINKYNGSISFNFRKGKWSFSSNYGVRYGQIWQTGYNKRDNLSNGVYSNAINQTEREEKYNTVHLLTTNLEYTLDSGKVLGLSAMVNYNYSNEEQIFDYDLQDLNRSSYLKKSRQIIQHANVYNYDLNAYYKKNYRPSGRELFISGAYSNGYNEANNSFTQNAFALPSGMALPISLSHTVPIAKNNIYVAQMDYNTPWGKNTKLETGLKSTYRWLDNNLGADSLPSGSSEYVTDYGKANHFLYQESVSAVYGIIQQNFNHGYVASAGLRFEQTFIDANLISQGISTSRTYTNFFPNVYISKKFSKERELRLNYSRRINRPNFQSLNPFPSYDDAYNLRKGNPYLNPEYIDGVELSFLKNWKEHSISSSIYYRQINGAIQRLTSVDTLGVSTTQFYNLSYAQNFGAEVICKSQLFSWLNATINLNGFRNILHGGNENGGELNNSNFGFNGKLIFDIKFWKNANLQFMGNYASPLVTPQGNTLSNNGIDVGFKKDIIASKLNFTLGITDVFNTRNLIGTSVGNDFSIQVFRKRETRVLTLTLTYKFGIEPPKARTMPKKSTNNFEGGNGLD